MNDYLVWGEGFAAYAIANALRHTDSISWPFAILLGCATSNFVRVNLQKIVRSFPRDSVFDGIARTLAFFDQVAPVAPLANAGEAPVVVNPVVVSNADEKMVKSFKSSRMYTSRSPRMRSWVTDTPWCSDVAGSFNIRSSMTMAELCHNLINGIPMPIHS